MSSSLDYTYEFNDGEVITVQQDADILGATVWDSCLVLSKFVEKALERLAKTGFGGAGTRAAGASKLRPTRILELGAGCGLLGLVAAHVLPTADVFVSDVEKVLPILGRNSNGNTNVVPLVLEWLSEAQCNGKSPLPDNVKQILPVDIILISDCVYDEECFAPLNHTLYALCEANPNTLVIMAYERRKFDTEVSFFKQFGEKFRFRHVLLEDLDPRYSAPEEIYVFLAKLRVDKEDF
ncbi:UNVERIFIED_CONTAM: Methyltransferase-like protein 21D [Siphonaria sp. JEL0065]|nr:Methyltransferase-like protein 21D [Siphonaria sp. JEL0065]